MANKRKDEVQFSEVESPTSKKKTPKWLRRLEAESWQAELLISGLVIAGLLQMPDILVHYIESYVLESSEIGYQFLFIASTLLVGAIDILIIFFGIHFIFRAIWISMLGLNSVYPEGIDVESTNNAGPEYWKKAKEQFPNLAAYNQELDQNCSLIFSMATVTIITMTSFTAIIFFIYLIFRFSISYFPFIANYIVHIGVGLYLIFMVMAFGMQYLTKKAKGNKKLEKIVTRYGDIMGTVFSLYIFKKPSGYISSILISNTTSKSFFYISILLGGFIGYFGGRQTDTPIFNHLAPDSYYSFNNKAYESLIHNYDNLRLKDTRIFTPVIPSDIIKESPVKLFIPIIFREREHTKIIDYSIKERFMMSRATKDSISQVNLNKYAAFNQIYVNEVAYPDLDFQYYTHPNGDEDGILTYIPTDQFIKGKNVLEIRKNYFSKDDVQKIVKIPFYFEGNKE